MVFGACLFPILVSSVAMLVNVVALFYHASRAIPITSMVTMATYVHVTMATYSLVFLATISNGYFYVFSSNLIGRWVFKLYYR